MCQPEQQKIEEVKVEELPKLRKVEVKPKEEPAKKEVTKTKVKIPKAKKYEELPEIPDYERAQLEVYEESEFELSKKAGEKEESISTAKPQQAVESIQEEEKPKNGLPKVSVKPLHNTKNSSKIFFVTILISIFPKLYVLCNKSRKHVHTL